MRGNITKDQLLKKADDALYQAKNKGKNNSVMLK